MNSLDTDTVEHGTAKQPFEVPPLIQAARSARMVLKSFATQAQSAVLTVGCLDMSVLRMLLQPFGGPGIDKLTNTGEPERLPRMPALAVLRPCSQPISSWKLYHCAWMYGGIFAGRLGKHMPHRPGSQQNAMYQHEE